MDPITAAAAILSITGLGDWLKAKLGGTIGDNAASKVIDIAKVVTGVQSPEEIQLHLQNDANLVTELRNKLIDNSQEIARLEFSDRENARAMQIAALNQSDIFSKRFVYYLATAWSAFAMLYIAFITFGQIPVSNVRFADTILGFLLGTVVATILAYFFGSSAANKAKDASISGLIDAVKGANK